MYVAKRMTFRKTAALEQQKLLETLKKVVALARVLPRAQSIRRDLVGARRTTEAEIDAARETAPPAP